MAKETAEDTAVVAEENEVQGDDVSKESEPSDAGQVASGEPEEAPESEEESEQPTKDEEEEESYEQKLDRLAQSKADKANATLQKENQRLMGRDKEISLLLYDKASANQFDDEVEALGEDKATERKKVRDAARKDFQEYLDNNQTVKQGMALFGSSDFEQIQAFLEDTKSKDIMEAYAKMTSFYARQVYREKIWNLIPDDDPKKVEKVNKHLKSFDNVQYEHEAEAKFEGIKAKLGTGSKTTKADSAKPSGTATFDRSKLTGRQKLELGLKEAEKEKSR